MVSTMKTFSQFIPFNLADPAGVAFFANVIGLSHQAVEQFIIASDIAWEDWFASARVAAPIVNVDTEFMKPLFPGKEYKFKVSILKMGTSSIKFNIDITKDEEICAKTKLTVVFISKETEKSVPIPEEFRKKLS